jgi:outer membrane protein assembly factor BamB
MITSEANSRTIGWLRCCGVLLATSLFATLSVRGDDWPQWLGPQRDGVWRETGILDKLPAGGPMVLWRVPVGSGFSGPAVANSRVYVMDRQVEMPAAGEPGKPPTGVIRGKERVLCHQAADGSMLWKDEYDCPYKIAYPQGPRTTPLVHDGKVYTLGAMGDLRCYDAETGKLHWSKKLTEAYKAEPPVWGWASHLLLHDGRLFCLVGGKSSAVVAFDPANGKELWRALDAEEVGYCPPMVCEAGGKKQLLIWLDLAIHSLDPATGKPYWSIPYPKDGKPQRPVVTIATPRLAGDLLLISAFYNGGLMLRLSANKPDATEVWRGKSANPGKPDTLHTIMSMPVIKDGYIYGVCGFGQLRCLEAATGKQVWETLAVFNDKKAFFGTAFIVAQGDRYFLFSDQGDLIIARLSPKGYEEIDRGHLLEATVTSRGRAVVWCHPAFAARCMFLRNDKEMLCISLAARAGN